MRLYSHADYEELSSWYEGHNMPIPPSDSLPEVGAFIPKVAAAFLYSTDSSICFLEGYISNPESSKEERDLAIDEITEALLAMAYELGFKHVLAMTNHPSLEKRARYWGFSSKGMQKLIYKELE